MTFKQLIKAIDGAWNKREIDTIMGWIDTSFEQDKITWNDHQMLRSIAEKIRWGLE